MRSLYSLAKIFMIGKFAILLSQDSGPDASYITENLEDAISACDIIDDERLRSDSAKSISLYRIFPKQRYSARKSYDTIHYDSTAAISQPLAYKQPYTLDSMNIGNMRTSDTE